MAKRIRTFIAIETPESVKAAARKLIAALEGTSANVRWVRPADLHFTLKFLGELRMEDVAEVLAETTVAMRGIEPFDLEVRGAGAFPRHAQPRTVWLGVGQGAEAMRQLHDALEARLSPLGYRSEHRLFRPHLTIGRVRNSPQGIAELGDAISQQVDFAGGFMEVSEVVVYSSVLTREGPAYEELGAAELRG